MMLCPSNQTFHAERSFTRSRRVGDHGDRTQWHAPPISSRFRTPRIHVTDRLFFVMLFSFACRETPTLLVRLSIIPNAGLVSEALLSHFR